MEIITTGLFKFDPKKTYVIIDNNKNEHASLVIQDETVFVKFNDNATDDLEFDNSIDLQNWIKENNYMITSDSVRWVLYNPNPKTNKANDCSIRAYCAAEDIKWDDAYDTACQYGKLNYIMPNDSKNCKNILEEEYGYTYHKLPKEKKGQTVKEFAINNSSGIYILDCPSHLVTVIDGEYYDSWDSGDKKIKGWYSK